MIISTEQDLLAGHAPGNAPVPSRGRLLQAAFTLENLGVVAVLALMTLIPLADVVYRKLGILHISGSTSLVQHLTLLAGVFGGAIAARDNRLLALSAATSFLKGRWRLAAQFFSGSVAAAITVFLAVAGAKFVLSEKTAGSTLAYEIPSWWVQIFMPIGFGAIALRLVWHASEGWWGRLAALALAGGLVAVGGFPPVAVPNLVWPAMILLLVATLAGAPLFVSLGGAALVLFWGQDSPIASITLDHYRLVTNPMLPTIPLFTLAGYFLAEGGASKRLVRVFETLVGSVRGGPAIVTTLVCAFFTSFTGASGVTILALGGLLMPVLISAKYSERQALGLVTSAGSLGMLLPPCLPVILYAVIAQVGIKEMFVGGFLPGMLLIGMTAAWGLWIGRTSPPRSQKFDLSALGRAVWDAKWELLLPVVSLAALLGGWATPVEAAAITAFYAFLVEAVFYRDLKILTDCPRVMTEAGLLVGGILLILGVALGFTNYLVDMQVPGQLADWALVHVKSRWLFLLGLNVILLLVGGVVEIYAAIIVVVPLLVPIGAKLGIDPVHLGIIFLANMELGFLAPPVGLNLLLSSYRFNKPIMEVTRAVLPMLGVLFVGVLLITYIPALTTWLPSVLK
jgi:tripartite ATP-independent transporter DctM subunit